LENQNFELLKKKVSERNIDSLLGENIETKEQRINDIFIGKERDKKFIELNEFDMN